MCGIAGFVQAEPGSFVSRVPSVLSLLSHRGPDGTGCLVHTHGQTTLSSLWNPPQADPEVVLLHKRLSIIDVGDSGWQPMSTPDGRYFIVFNGEIYNYIELREELRHLGYTFRSHSDTEVLLIALAAWGIAALPRLVGMFAFALLDTQRRTVLLARDFFGIKPLYYSHTETSFAFASELKALLEFTESTRHADSDRVFLYLRHGASDFGSRTLFSGVRQLPPAHYLEISVDKPEPRDPVPFWKPTIDRDLDISFEEASSRLRELFLKNVALHLRSDVPVGAALSGGIDSSSIVMAMRHLQPDLDIHTFSYVSDDQALNEEHWADIVATASGAHSHKVHANADTMLADIDPLTYMQDEPFGSTSIYAQYCVFREAQRAGIKVMLDGQGADEILGGYRYYLGARLASLVRQQRYSDAFAFVQNASATSGAGKLFITSLAADYLLPAALQTPLRHLAGKDFAPAWLDYKWFQQRTFFHDFARYTKNRMVLRESLYRTLTESSLPHLLRYEDRNSMAFSIESRVPFLTPEIVDFMLSLPEHYIISSAGLSKHVFRSAMRGIVPDAILDRRDKVGFATPETWLTTAGKWVRKVLLSDAAAGVPFLKVRSAQQSWDAVERGKSPVSAYLWRWLNLIRWTDQYQVRYD